MWCGKGWKHAENSEQFFRYIANSLILLSSLTGDLTTVNVHQIWGAIVNSRLSFFHLQKIRHVFLEGKTHNMLSLHLYLMHPHPVPVIGDNVIHLEFFWYLNCIFYIYIFQILHFKKNDHVIHLSVVSLPNEDLMPCHWRNTIL